MRARMKCAVNGSISRFANYLTANEEKIFLIFDYVKRKPILVIEEEIKRKEIKCDKKTTNQSKTL